MLRMSDSKSLEDKMGLEKRDKVLSQVAENNFSVTIHPFWEITEKGNAWRDIFNTLVSDHHPKSGTSIRNVADTQRQEIGKVMLSAQEIVMHQKWKLFSSNRTSAPGEKMFEPWLTYHNRSLQEWQ